MNPVNPARSVRTTAILMLIVANVLWALSFPLVKALVLVHERLMPGTGNWFIVAGTVGPRMLLATLLLLVVLWRRLGTFTRAELRQGLVIGLGTGAGMLLQNDGLQFTSASVSAFLTPFYAILIPLWLACRRRRWPSLLVCACSALVLAGVAILGRFDLATLRLGRGEAETLLSSVFFMTAILALAQPRYAANRALPVTLVMFAVQALLFGGLAVATAPSAAALLVPWTSGPWVLFTGLLTVGCTLIAFGLMNHWQPKITPTEAGLLYCLEPVAAAIFALFLPAHLSALAGVDYPNERLTWHLLAGGGLITAANLALQSRPGKDA
ncbi:MAG: EamA family transporter [Opitutaceae bacterium]|nr:EamA family transporter [Opitutaceae bacterium]